jgi:hypothetical protein
MQFSLTDAAHVLGMLPSGRLKSLWRQSCRVLRPPLVQTGAKRECPLSQAHLEAVRHGMTPATLLTEWWLTRPMSEGTDEREADLVRREAEVAAREAALTMRGEAADEILDAADERDTIADARDTTADQRETDHDLAGLLALNREHGYGGDWPERRNAALDRAQAKQDRASSHDDRLALTESNAEDGTDEA